MSNTYDDFLREAGYKHSVDKPNTSSSLAFYEEAGKISHRVDTSAIWIDSEFIPPEAPQVNASGYYTVNIGSLRDVKILYKVSDLVLDKVRGTTATFRGTRTANSTNDIDATLLDAIFPSYGSGYSVILKDASGEIIPFGLNKWIIDPDNGTLSFIDGVPQGYSSPFTISFYRYVGRKANKTMLLSNGAIPMDEGYTPSREKDIATKEYVDSKNIKIEADISKLIPDTPPTLENAELFVEGVDEEGTDIKVLSPWNSTEEVPVILIDEKHISEYKIRIPLFYKPDVSSTFRTYINGSVRFSENLATTLVGTYANSWYVESIVDPYKNDIVANGFYKSIKSFLRLPLSMISDKLSPENPILEIVVSEFVDNKELKSKPLRIGFTDWVNNPKLGDIKLSNFENEESSFFKSISGVPTITANSKFTLEYTARAIPDFKNTRISHLKVNGDLEDSIIVEKDIETEATYDNQYPIQKIKEEITIPEGYTSEHLNMTLSLNDILLRDIKDEKQDRKYNIRIDTLSDETLRKVSPTTEELKTAKFIAKDWTSEKSRESLIENNELQMLYGKYQWPSGNYSSNGNFSEEAKEGDVVFENQTIADGPDYSKIKDGIRYVTFAYDMANGCNGFWISLKDCEGSESDEHTHAFTNIPIFKCMVEGKTCWLDMNTPFEGVLTPMDFTSENINSSDNNSYGCLVVPSSTEDKKYITFGNIPLGGKLIITVGIEKSNIKFSGVEIVFNK